VINLKPEQITEWNGFDVYDAETEVDLLPSEVAEESFPEDKALALLACEFCLTWDGCLLLLKDDGGTVYVPHEGKYLIQINDEKYMRW
jgi:hypothetical protein